VKQLIAFTKKEFYESTATFRLYILLAVFVLLGVMGPLMALLTPAILESVSAGDAAIVISIPDPTAIDAWAQFFSGIIQMGMPILAIIFSGIMANEFSKGTLVNLLTKGLKRHTVILSKFIGASALWTISFLLSIGVCYAYTAYYWETGPISHVFLTFGAPWLFGLFMISLLLFGGTLFGNFYGSLFSCLGVVLALIFASAIPLIATYSPTTLTGTLSLINGTGEPADFMRAMVLCAILIIGLIGGSIAVFNKKTV